jgi:hypothetical protein
MEDIQLKEKQIFSERSTPNVRTRSLTASQSITNSVPFLLNEVENVISPRESMFKVNIIVMSKRRRGHTGSDLKAGYIAFTTKQVSFPHPFVRLPFRCSVLSSLASYYSFFRCG